MAGLRAVGEISAQANMADKEVSQFHKDVMIDIFNEAGQKVISYHVPLGVGVPGASRPRRKRQRGGHPAPEARERGLVDSEPNRSSRPHRPSSFNRRPGSRALALPTAQPQPHCSPPGRRGRGTVDRASLLRSLGALPSDVSVEPSASATPAARAARGVFSDTLDAVSTCPPRRRSPRWPCRSTSCSRSRPRSRRPRSRCRTTLPRMPLNEEPPGRWPNERICGSKICSTAAWCKRAHHRRWCLAAHELPYETARTGGRRAGRQRPGRADRN